MQHIRNLVFEGGGVKGIAYVGAMSVLKERGILQNCKRFCGNSAGAISAWLSTYFFNDLQALEALQKETNFAKFMDDDAGIIRDTRRVLRQYGWHKGDHFYQWAQDVTKQQYGKKNLTFKEHAQKTGRDLVITACNVSKAKTIWFSKYHTPDLYVEKALRMSMSIPVFFKGVFLSDDNVDGEGSIMGNPRIDLHYKRDRELIVDGGVIDNFSVQAFDNQRTLNNPVSGEEIVTLPNRKNPIYNKSTLGLRLDTDKEIQFDSGNVDPSDDYFEAKNFFNYLINLVDMVHMTANKRHLDDFDWHRTIRIDDQGVKSTDFDLTPDTQNALIASGRSAVIDYIDKYEDIGRTFLNRP